MWRDRFEKKILDRGYKYYFNNKAKFIEEKDNLLKFKVSGTKEYTVVIDVYRRNSACTCPYEQNCKHMVASIYEYNSKGKKISKYDSEEIKRRINDIIRMCDEDKFETELMEVLDDDINEYIDCGFNRLAFSSLEYTFTRLAYYSDLFFFDTLSIIKDKIVELMAKSLESMERDSQVKLLNRFYKKIKKIENDNTMSFFFYRHLDDIFTQLNDEVINILIDNIYINENVFTKKLFNIYAKLGRDKDMLELIEKFSDNEVGYKYIIEMEEKKENYDKVIEYCEKAIKRCRGNSYFVEYIINITRGVDKYFDIFYENVLIKFENIHEITYEDYKMVCEKLPGYQVDVFKNHILDNIIKVGDYVKILFYKKMYEEILNLNSYKIFEFDYIAEYMAEKYSDRLYSKLRDEILRLIHISNSTAAYKYLSNVMDNINKLKKRYKKRNALEKELFEMYPEKKMFRKILSYI